MGGGAGKKSGGGFSCPAGQVRHSGACLLDEVPVTNMDDRQFRGVTLNSKLDRGHARRTFKLGKIGQQAGDEEFEHEGIFPQSPKPRQFQLYSQQLTAVSFVSPLRFEANRNQEQLPAGLNKDV
jgi:hypothetical protein